MLLQILFLEELLGDTFPTQVCVDFRPERQRLGLACRLVQQQIPGLCIREIFQLGIP
jgi:hypothetical protein